MIIRSVVITHWPFRVPTFPSVCPQGFPEPHEGFSQLSIYCCLCKLSHFQVIRKQFRKLHDTRLACPVTFYLVLLKGPLTTVWLLISRALEPRTLLHHRVWNLFFRTYKLRPPLMEKGETVAKHDHGKAPFMDSSTSTLVLHFTCRCGWSIPGKVSSEHMLRDP